MHFVRGGQTGSGEPSSNPLFEGTAVLQNLIDAGGLRVNEVEFIDGARTKWHTHSFEQILIVTSGAGAVATDEGEWAVGPGDIVMFDAGERHWHGAQANNSMTHISINGPGETQW
jgi:quercetin dioxygenase-like cupin family protein